MISPEIKNLRSLYQDAQISADLTSKSTLIIGSPVHIHKLILNLITNGLESLSAGGRVAVSTETVYNFKSETEQVTIPENDYVVMRVKDNGEGITKEDLPKIFEPFFTRKVMGRSGTGLGMAVVWGTVQDHEAFIEITSEPGMGTLIEVFFSFSQRSPGFLRYGRSQ